VAAHPPPVLQAPPAKLDFADVLIAGGAAIGLFTIGRAAVDHVLASRGPVKPTNLAHAKPGVPKRAADDVVAFLAAIAGLTITAVGTVEAVKEWLGTK